MSESDQLDAPEQDHTMPDDWQRPPQNPRSRLIAVASAVTAIVITVTAMIVINVMLDNAESKEHTAATGASASVPTTQPPTITKIITAVSAIPPSILDQVGKGEILALPTPLKDQPVLKDGDKPLVLFIGSEACPHCGTQRWAIAIAFARFGTFSGLKTSPAGNRPTSLSFHGATYTSQYVAFQAVEIATSTGEPLDRPTEQQQAIMQSYGTGGIPFLDFGNRYIMVGSSYSATTFAGKSASQIAETLTDPASPITKAIVGGANALTTAICGVTNNQPTDVCSGPAAQAYAGAF